MTFKNKTFIAAALSIIAVLFTFTSCQNSNQEDDDKLGASSNRKIYMYIDGLKGNVKDAGYEDTFSAESYSYNGYDSDRVERFEIKRLVDNDTPKLNNLLTSGEKKDITIIIIFKDNYTYKIQIKNAKIISDIIETEPFEDYFNIVERFSFESKDVEYITN